MRPIEVGCEIDQVKSFRVRGSEEQGNAGG